MEWRCITNPNKRTGTKSERREFATAIEAEEEAARLRSFGFSAYARTKAAKPRGIRGKGEKP